MNSNQYPQGEIKEITIDIPKKLYELVTKMAEISNKDFSTQLTAEDLISKLSVTYFGTRNSIDIMSYSLHKLPELLSVHKADIEKCNDEFNKTILRLDELSRETNSLFHKVIDKLETL